MHPRSPTADAGASPWPLVAMLAAIACPACDSSSSDAVTVAYARPLGYLASAASATLRSRPAQACPPEMALVGSVCVDRHEAHLVLAETPEVMHPPYERPVPGERYLARSVPGVMPQAYISRDEAAVSCERAGKRLCSAQEWRAACRGPKKTLYPYGPEEIRGRCNIGKAHLPSILFGMQSSVINAESNFNNPLLDQTPGYLAKTGEYAACVNEYGIFDLDGNLHEWVSDQIWALGRRAVFMGAFFSSTAKDGPGCQHVSRRHSPLYRDYSIGFRCCMNRAAEPSGGGE